MPDAPAWTARGLAVDAACIDAETWPVPIDESRTERACGVRTIDAALINGETTPSHARCNPHRFRRGELTIDAAGIDAAGECLAWTARGLAIDAACIDAETWPVPIDESRIERACGVRSIDAALIDGETRRLMFDAARIDFDSSGLTIDAACIDAAGECLAWTARGLSRSMSSPSRS